MTRTSCSPFSRNLTCCGLANTAEIASADQFVPIPSLKSAATIRGNIKSEPLPIPTAPLIPTAAIEAAHSVPSKARCKLQTRFNSARRCSGVRSGLLRILHSSASNSRMLFAEESSGSEARTPDFGRDSV